MSEIGRRIEEEINNRFGVMFDCVLEQACETVRSGAPADEVIVEYQQLGPRSATVCLRREDGTLKPMLRLFGGLEAGMLTIKTANCADEVPREQAPGTDITSWRPR